jgi:hypothetical protein
MLESEANCHQFYANSDDSFGIFNDKAFLIAQKCYRLWSPLRYCLCGSSSPTNPSHRLTHERTPGQKSEHLVYVPGYAIRSTNSALEIIFIVRLHGVLAKCNVAWTTFTTNNYYCIIFPLTIDMTTSHPASRCDTFPSATLRYVRWNCLPWKSTLASLQGHANPPGSQGSGAIRDSPQICLALCKWFYVSLYLSALCVLQAASSIQNQHF